MQSGERKGVNPLMNSQTIPAICDHIRRNAELKGLYILELNAVPDHMHCLVALKSDWSIAKQVQMIKGEAANWINRQAFIKTKFEWADEYFAASVSKDKLDVVKAYIQNQEEHHRKKSFNEEYRLFLTSYGFSQG
jgi:putative transposase